jgi:NAD(P)-dependent dehydrogenase (short-subunit alcohol dehydrogenase family)
MDLDGITMNRRRVVIVTGAAGTIGVATATELERQDWQVVRLDRKEDLRRRTAGVNLADSAAIRASFRRIEDEYGGADALVNNAGIFIGKSWDEITDEEVDQTFAVNLRGPLLLSTLFARAAIAGKRQASIVNVASVAGREPGHDVVYAASKAALIHMTRGLGRQLAPHGVRVNAVAPGVVTGTMADRIPELTRSSYLERTPMQRFAEPVEIAAVISFLLSTAASYMTGAIIDVNGGLF